MAKYSIEFQKGKTTSKLKESGNQTQSQRQDLPRPEISKVLILTMTLLSPRNTSKGVKITIEDKRKVKNKRGISLRGRHQGSPAV